MPSGAVWEYLKKKGGVMSKSDGYIIEVSDGGEEEEEEEEKKSKKDNLFCCEWREYDHGDFLVHESNREAQDAIVGMVQKLSSDVL